jgi:hypothetical protein
VYAQPRACENDLSRVEGERRDLPARIMGSMTFSKAVSDDSKLNVWNTKPLPTRAMSATHTHTHGRPHRERAAYNRERRISESSVSVVDRDMPVRVCVCV